VRPSPATIAGTTNPRTQNVVTKGTLFGPLRLFLVRPAGAQDDKIAVAGEP
jgi:hypothetical protein